MPMAEPSAETAPRAGASEANVVLATKLYLPASSRDLCRGRAWWPSWMRRWPGT